MSGITGLTWFAIEFCHLMWYPDKTHWLVIWIMAAMACVALLVAYDIYGAVLSTLLIGALLLWKLSNRA